MRQVSDAALALAALSICENLLVTLIDRELISREDVEELLEDAAEGQSALGNGDFQAGEEAAEIIRDIMDGIAPET